MASPTPLSKANTTFSLALFKKLSDNDKTANIFYSPFSISSALAMVMLGARGNTATQMSEVKHTHCDNQVTVLTLTHPSGGKWHPLKSHDKSVDMFHLGVGNLPSYYCNRNKSKRCGLRFLFWPVHMFFKAVHFNLSVWQGEVWQDCLHTHRLLILSSSVSKNRGDLFCSDLEFRKKHGYIFC